MELKDVYKQCHRIIETQDKQDYGNAEIAKRIGVTKQTYEKYKRGEITPLSVNAVLNLLSCMNDEHIIQIIRDWEKKSKRKGEK